MTCENCVNGQFLFVVLSIMGTERTSRNIITGDTGSMLSEQIHGGLLARLINYTLDSNSMYYRASYNQLNIQ